MDASARRGAARALVKFFSNDGHEKAKPDGPDP
jgi:hypothetical protein